MDNNQKEAYLLNATGKEVKLWTCEYIPFEPSGWKKKLKQELREALKNMQPEPYDGLYASYQARQSHFCDIENVLLYNVGSGAFSHLSAPSICIEGKFASQDQAVREDLPHLYHYELSQQPTFKCWKPRQTIVQWTGENLSRMEQTSAFFWYYIKNAQHSISFKQSTEKFGIHVLIRTPRRSLNIASMIKPMLDGIICAYHKHDHLINDQVYRVLSHHLGISEDKIDLLLKDEQLNVLGSRSLLQSYRNGVKWNPADEHCLAIKVEVEHLAESWRVDGQLFTIV